MRILRFVKTTSMMRKNLFTSGHQNRHWTGYSWIRSIDVRKPVVMMIWLVMWRMTKTGFWYWIMVLVLDVEYRWYWVMGWVMTLMNVAGSPSPVGSMLHYPNKPKISQKPNKFRIFLIWTIFLLSTTRNHSESHLEPPCVIFGIYVFNWDKRFNWLRH